MVCYCHNCGGSGGIKAKHTLASAIDVITKDPTAYAGTQQTKPKRTELPRDLEKLRGKQFAWAVRYLDSGTIDATLAYSHSEGGIVMPLKNLSGSLIGYQVRMDEGSPRKYVTYGIVTNRLYHATDGFTYHPKAVRCACVVEDYVSAEKVAHIMPAVAMMGSYLHDEPLSALIHLDKVYVFLDNDNDQIIAERGRIANRLRTFGVDVTIVESDGRDPKEFSLDELREMLKP